MPTDICYPRLKPGTLFGIYDVMQTQEGTFAFPVPWADEMVLSHLSTPNEYKEALSQADFTISAVNSRRDTAVAFFAQMRARAAEGNGSPRWDCMC